MSSCDPHCKGCIYLGCVGGGMGCCNYIFIEGKRRPCPPGKECTVKTTERQLKKATPKPKVHGTKKICEFCGKEFVLHNNLKQKYCCYGCRKEAYKIKDREGSWKK